jgi:glutaminyl-peptide cyclotransferase
VCLAVTRALVALCCAGALVSCGTPAATWDPDLGADAAIRAGISAGIPVAHPTVLARVPHDSRSWTEGLELSGGLLYEGTGLTGRSELRELDPVTGRVLRIAELPGQRYGEGITVLGDRIWQLTYTERVGLPWDRTTLSAGPPVPYPGEGWGLCHDAAGRMIASDGSPRLRLLTRDLRPTGSLEVRIAGRPLPALNELECAPDGVWANVFHTDYLVHIALPSGAVTEVVDASALTNEVSGLDSRVDVLNGIAAIPGTDEFLLTGKYWPLIFRVRFVR